MITIVASGSFVQTAKDELPNLKSLIKEKCRKPFRRIDRFIQLSLLGAATCVDDRILPSNTGLYLSTGQGAAGNTLEVFRQIFDQHNAPKPLNFVNTLGNSACFYIAQNFKLSGISCCISRLESSFEAALAQAQLDITTGAITDALVGVIDESTTPLADQRKRFYQAEDTPLAEGSHWLLLNSNSKTQTAEPTGNTVNLEASQEFYNIDDCQRWLEDYYPNNEIVLSSNTKTELFSKKTVAKINKKFSLTQGRYGYSPAQSGGDIVEIAKLAKKQMTSCIYINSTPDNSYIATVITSKTN